ncbi:cell division protein FtsA [Paraglaciecola chathamensis]|jgi:cell division protein FtsA|uniref:Cell division protein FtsA n=2 Tax=Paraglaciecola chathamensis TaxID=368405 RepID=A0ABS0W959_9ALTE|nr:MULTISPECIES: cell division protein FtsA [Paraglaciecola]AEE21812.1 cell division protein FtsA [Glaciecola sp. 4H-3-7+YE-5]MBN26346.1 cell division protein FtsA [Alteromonadaceae bacterium]MBJ2135289.1 cell division protein FtsA [Paraglaciecola chathamensis]MBU3017102.1 cell division protein FtsA [Paraglaciecola agarilytica]MDO6557850.1 cell division protein FtsA [Paraglaciecola chathamensis]|tara:strand:- start:39775 stop:41004 length:1230 start_codon:yes stop_codon:yes gene_type:complete
MSKVTDRKLIVGLDIGTSMVKAVVGELLDDGGISVIGVGSHPAKGMDKGGVNDLNLVVQSVQRAMSEMELMADCRVSSVFMSISGRHVQCQNESGMVPINNKEVTQEDVDNVIHAARSVPIAAERRLLHVLPQEFTIDVQEGIKNPIGMSGVRMEAQAHIITCADDMAKNLVKCVERCELTTDQLIFSSLASSYAVLTDDEKELGVCVVDIGGGTIDIVIYTDGAIRHTAVVPVAGNQITSDIAKIFRTPISHAEDIKINYACALKDMVSMEENIEVHSVGGRPSRAMSRHTLAEVIEPRYQELFELVQKEIRSSGFEEQIAAGIVLTGGTAKMEGAIEFAEEIFQMPVRVGEPLSIKGLSEYVEDPTFATAIGLLQYGKEHVAAKTAAKTKSSEGVWERIQSWFKGEF